jgi:hypothetical protein
MEPHKSERKRGPINDHEERRRKGGNNFKKDVNGSRVK